MKRLFMTCLALATGLLSLADAKGGGGSKSSGGKVNVSGYTRKDGTYVAPYTRNAPSSNGISSPSLPYSPIYTMPKTSNFSNCAEAHANGFYNIPAGSPAYDSSLDRDNDGIACESGSDSSSGAGSPGVAVMGPGGSEPDSFAPDSTFTGSSIPLSATCTKDASVTLSAAKAFDELKFNILSDVLPDAMISVGLDGESVYASSIMNPVDLQVGPHPAGTQVTFVLTALSQSVECAAQLSISDLQVMSGALGKKP